jgi:hypothetical protein
MGTRDFHIEILEQGWLEGSSPEEDPWDLCSHGKIKLEIGGQPITSGQEDYGISESALALLRTLANDHSQQHPVAQQLIFHGCSGLLMMTCPIGVDWSVTHLPGRVRVSDIVRYDTTNEAEGVRFPDLSVELDEEDYRREIVSFAKEAKRLFSGVTKRFSDDLDRDQFEAFWSEYEQLLVRYNDT